MAELEPDRPHHPAPVSLWRAGRRLARRVLTPGLVLGFLAIAGLLLGANLVGQRSLQDVRDAAGAVAHTQAVKSGLQELLTTLIDAETGQRGFVITGEEAYLEPYARADARLARQIVRLRELVGADPEQVGDVDRLRELAQDKFDELARTVEIRRKLDFNAAQALMLNDTGRRIMQEMRAIVARLELREDTLLARRVARADASYRSARLTAQIGTGVALVALGALFLGTRRLGRERLRSAALAERLDVTLASIGDAVIVADGHGRIVRMNPVAEGLTGWRDADADGRPLAEVFVIVNENTREGVPSPVERALAEGAVVGLANHTILIAKDGRETAIDDSAAPIRAEDGTIAGVVMVFRDVTARREAERAAQEADRRKDEFLAMLSHELRNPLGAVTNASEVIKQLAPADGKLRVASEVIARQAAHLARILDDLLDVSRVSRGRIVLRPRPVQLASVIGVALDAARPLIDSRAQQFAAQVPAEPIWVEADATRLAQVIGNLLGNASKYTPVGGSLSLALGREGGEAVIRVRDTGVGIAAELLPRVFELFVQGERPADASQGGPGLGLGLTLAKRLTEMHGGRLDAHSDGPGKGSEFVVRLPALAGSRALPERPRPAAPQAAARRRILVVDDHADARESLALALDLTGHDVRVAEDGRSALEAAAAFLPEVVLLDIGLPGMDGYEVARRLRADAGTRPMLLVALTGYGQEGDRLRAREAGFQHHLVKPASPDSILTLLDQGPPASPATGA